MTFEELSTLLKAHKISHTTEAEMQESIEQLLKSKDIKYSREHKLSDKDKVDFFVEGTIIECKIKGQALEIFRQVERYAKHDVVTGVILFTSYHMGIKDKINEKPACVIKPGYAWL